MNIRFLFTSLLSLTTIFTMFSCGSDEEPIANFSIENNGCSAPCTISFTDNSLGDNLSYQWDFGDGSASTDKNPSHVYNSQGSWEVTHNVRNDAGFSQIKKTVNIN